MNTTQSVRVSVLPIPTFAVLQHVRISQLLTILAYVSTVLWLLVLLSTIARALHRSLYHSRAQPLKQTPQPAQSSTKSIEGATAWTSEL